MARRHPPPDRELAALARERLARVLGGDRAAARRAAPLLDARDDEEEGPVADVRAGDVARRPVGPDDLEPPRRFTRWHAGVVATVLLVGLVWGGWSWVRARPEAVAAPPVVQTAVPTSSGAASPVPGGVASAGPAGTRPSEGGPVGRLVVHVLGAVRHPGLVRLAAGARVQDAIDVAGGLRPDADPEELNLAQPLDDGVQVVVGTKSHPAGEVRSSGGGGGAGGPGSSTGSGSGSGTGTGGTTSGSPGPGGAVDLNRATVDQLDTLPGVGPVTAQKIADWRQQHGRFSRTEELQEVDGIGPKTYARIAPHVRV